MSRPTPLLAVRRLSVHFPLASGLPWRDAGAIRAVDGVDFDLVEGEVLGILGESGSGKSALSWALAGLRPATSGAAEYRGQALSRLDARGWRRLRSEIQLVLQTPAASLDPRMRVQALLEQPLRAVFPAWDAHRRAARSHEVLSWLGLAGDVERAWASELSADQAARLALARALAVAPQLLLLDDPFTALSEAERRSLLALLDSARRSLGFGLLYLSRDPAALYALCPRLLVLCDGRIVEQGERKILDRPAHPYTQGLLAGVAPASEREPSPGCSYVLRCPLADERCTRLVPHLRRVGHGGHAACHYVGMDAAAA